MTIRFPHLRAAVLGQPWAIMPGNLESIAEVLERRIEGVRLTPEQIAGHKGDRTVHGSLHLVPMAFDQGDEQAQRSRPAQAAQQGQGSPQGSVIAVINVQGIIAQHAAQVDDISGPGGTSTERVAASLSTALGDPAVKAVVLNIDSPGGNVYGVQELGEHILASRGSKPIVAQVNSLAASAAYWIASAADEIVVTPSGQVGSIGVYGMHEDMSGALGKAGLVFTFVSAGRYKVEGNRTEPLGDEAREAMQASVDSYYDSFVKAVARGRGRTVGEVRGGFGEGRVVRAAEAVKLGMADSVATMNETLRRLGAARSGSGAKASAEPIPLLGGSEPSEPPAATAVPNTAPAAGDNDAFRRRRHAHRARLA